MFRRLKGLALRQSQRSVAASLASFGPEQIRFTGGPVEPTGDS
ncbi:MAG: hypothetical protein ACYCS7_01210 [Acidimicrobiales bacterium]